MSVHRHTPHRLRLLVAVGFSGWVLGGVAVAAAQASAKPPVDLAAGRAAYEQHCARCHGPTGAGDGLDAKHFFPRPRKFTDGIYKFRTTASGTAPTDEDLLHSINHGLAGGGMPDWQQLDEATRWQLIAYLKTLSPVFQDAPPEPVALGTDPGRRRVDLAQGKAVYEKLGCAACHGTQGRANGMSAATLVDNWGDPIRAANLTQGWNYRGGSDPKAIVERMMSGIDGTPMPSYAEAATPEEAWQMAYYVQSLQEPAHWGVIARVPPIGGPLPSTADDARWARSPTWTMPLRPAVNSDGAITAPHTVNAVAFQALHTDEAIAFRVIWDDPSESRQDPADVLGLALRPAGVDGDVVSLQAWPLATTPPLDWCVWVAGPSTGDTSSAAGMVPPRSSAGGTAYERLARNYDSVLKRNGHPAVLASQAAYDNGRWTLVVQRPLAGQGEVAALDPARFHPVAFAVWDGGNPDQRAVSIGIDLSLERPGLTEAAAQTSSPKGPAAQAARNVWVWLASGLVLVIALALIIRNKKEEH